MVQIVSKFIKHIVLSGFLLLCSIEAVADKNTAAYQSLQHIIDLQRKVIYLVSNEGASDNVKERDTFIARNLYYQKRELLDNYESVIMAAEAMASIESEAKRIASDARAESIEALFSVVDSELIHAADLLAFTDLVDSIRHSQNESPFLSEKQTLQLKSIYSDMERIANFYQDDIANMYRELGTRGKKLEAWSSYIKFLDARYDRVKIRKQFNLKGAELKEPAARGTGKSKNKDPNTVWGYGIPEKTVVLTFDDGPHYRYTDEILDTLKKYNANAYFFAVGKNFGSANDGEFALKKNAQKLKRALSEGHRLGNHSFTHRVLTKLEPNERLHELEDTNTLLAQVATNTNTVFRPPYGSKDERLQALTIAQGMRSIMWSVDSMDWGDPIPDSIVTRVMEQLKKDKRGIILFHDIHKQTVKALPKLLDELVKGGYKFVDIDGKPFHSTADTAQAAEPATPKTSRGSQYYKDSWAVIIGINNYDEWPKLSYAVNDATAVRDALINQYQFKPENIYTLIDKDANRERISELLGDTLANPEKVKPGDRVFIFYAGHGMTRKLPSGRDLGYIIPVDAALDKFHTRSISMTHLRDFSDMIPAKHVYFVMDSCYSGIALTRSGGAVKTNSYIDEITKRNARQILTAGGADQQVSDGGPGGHSIFTWAFLQGLSGRADLDGNKVITASEIGAFVAPEVSNVSNQTPAFGNMIGSEGGDFVFELAGGSALDDMQYAPEDEKIIELKKALEAANKRNQQLQQQLVDAGNKGGQSVDVQQVIQTLSPKQRKEKAVQLHEKGLGLYKAKKLQESKALLMRAVELSPSNPTIVNNYGFVLYKMGEYEASLKWLEKTIELEPKRTVVYLNIADTLLALNRSGEAIPYYEHYLNLHPSSPKAASIKAKMNALMPKVDGVKINDQ